MSVLSCSEVQFVGEQSPARKPAEDHREPVILQVDCPPQKSSDKLPLAALDGKHVLLEVDCVQPVHDVDQSNNNEEEDNSFLDNCASQGPVDEPLDGIFIAEESSPKIEDMNNKLVSDASFLETDSFCQEGCDFSNVASEKEGLFSEEGGSSKREIKLLDSLHKPNHYFSTAEGAKSAEVNGYELVDVPNNAGSVHIDTSDSQGGDDEDLPTALHELSDLACRTDFEQGIYAQCQSNGSFQSCDSSSQLLEKMDGDVDGSNQEGECGQLETECSEQDLPMALWVKWRGKWQTGIRCLRIDCPLSTLRAKPTHERKKYYAVFFPRTRTYSWVDELLVRSIDESPEPLAYGTHRRWRALVKDLMMPRRYIMQKLALSMLNISDRLHIQAVIENARNATAWKEFALEASRCRDYSDLGRTLLKLQTMILPGYVGHGWLENSFGSWAQSCQSARNAESVEKLTEELMGSVLWKELEKLWDAPVQPDLGVEWKSWKQEAMKWFSLSYPTSSVANTEQRNCDNSTNAEPQISWKRPKLEVRRAEVCTSLINGCMIPSKACTGETYEPSKMETLVQVAATSNFDTAGDRWERIMVRSEDSKSNQSSEVATSADRESDRKPVLNANHGADVSKMYRKCQAFIEAKGRQCGRWANDGDIYCCVHLNTRSVGKLYQEHETPSADAPMCKGKTTLGNSCKHRARYGSAFCKKHRLQGTSDSMHYDNLMDSSEIKHKRKHGENDVEKFPGSNLSVSNEYGFVGEVQTSVQENLIPIKVGETLDERNCLMKKSELYDALPTPSKDSCPDPPQCIGYYQQTNGEKCLENAKRHTLYCEKHIPRFLKRARDGKSRLISKDVFLSILNDCSSRKQKVYLHQACELLYGFMKSGLSRQKLVSKEENIGWMLLEASKDLNVGEYLLRLVSSEREKLMRLWGFGSDKDKEASSSETKVASAFEVQEKDDDPEMTIKCKICAEKFLDDQTLGLHWTEMHKKEARWLFRGYACAVCMNSFTNRKVLEAHVKERHGMQFLEHSILFRCMSCNSHFMNPEQLWQHVLSSHLMDLRLQNSSQQHNHNYLDPAAQSRIELGSKHYDDNAVSDKDGSQRFICRFCGLKFDLLPDLGRHHQVAHMSTNSLSCFPSKRGNPHFGLNRHHYRRFKRNFGTTFRIKNRTNFSMQKRISGSIIAPRARLQAQVSETVDLGRLLESHCSDIADTLFSKIHKTRPRPSNLEILSVARSACCRISLHAALVVKYGMLPENLYLKAAKLCSELNIQVGWHLEGFICPKGCKPLTQPQSLAPLKHIQNVVVEPSLTTTDPVNDAQWEMDECHYILDSKHFNWKPMRKAIILCEDVSLGRETIPIACVIDEDLKDALHINCDEVSSSQECGRSMPWLGFTYVTERLIDPSLGFNTKNSQLGCACPDLNCYPENCDHVYLFDNDYENASDIHGRPMRCRFPYDEKGRIILEEGYFVYECNSMCKCDATCHNRVLQKGVQVKLEVFKTIKKGWAVRAGEAISRGTFVCEYVGEVLCDAEANKRGERYDKEGCSYLYDIDAHIDNTRSLTEGKVPYVIDATRYGNISRFINHSCSPNLVNYQVLLESMDCQLAHIGFYACRDIAVGEELAYDYRYKLLPGDGCPCHCGAPNCRGRLY